MGWPTVDEMTGGLLPGDVASMIGRPAAGKTFQMLYGCHHAWHEQEKPGMFVSMEMNPLAIQQRLAAMNAHVPMSKLKNAALSTTAMGKLKGALTAVSKKDVPLWVVDGNLTATVEDIWMLAEQLKPEVIYIDGAYLLKHPTEKDRFKRVAENADLIKTRLAGDRPVVCSWQFAKTASQKAKKKNETVGLEDIGYSDAIAQVSSLVMGLFEEESVETLQSRRIEILKGRNGEVGSFSTRWDFTGMDFTELADVNLADLQIT
jgi:replicative DNA helicase